MVPFLPCVERTSNPWTGPVSQYYSLQATSNLLESHGGRARPQETFVKSPSQEQPEDPKETRGWEDGSLQADPKPPTAYISQAKAQWVQPASSGLSATPQKPSRVAKTQQPWPHGWGWGGSCYRQEALPTPLPMEPCSVGVHTQKTARHRLSSSKRLELMVLVVLAPSGPTWGEGQELQPRSLQSTRNTLTLAITSRVGSRQAREGWPWL